MRWLFQEWEAELLGLSDRDFIGVWSALFGEPPAAMIERGEMIGLMRAALEPDAAQALRAEARAMAVSLAETAVVLRVASPVR